MKTNVYKIELLIIDHDNVGEDLKVLIEEARYPNHCIGPHVMSIETCEVDWTDEHPLNKLNTMKETYEQLFSGG